MTQPYPAEEIPGALARLLEARHDLDEADRQLEEYRSANPPPSARRELSVDTLQDYHRDRMKYEAGLEGARGKQDASLERYEACLDEVRLFLPKRRRLHYEYQGEREDLAGRYIIEDTGRRLIIEPYPHARHRGPGAYGGRP
jgi:hypothetical protein